jgi:hypothetical protein
VVGGALGSEANLCGSLIQNLAPKKMVEDFVPNLLQSFASQLPAIKIIVNFTQVFSGYCVQYFGSLRNSRFIAGIGFDLP